MTRHVCLVAESFGACFFVRRRIVRDRVLFGDKCLADQPCAMSFLDSRKLIFFGQSFSRGFQTSQYHSIHAGARLKRQLATYILNSSWTSCLAQPRSKARI